MGTVLTYDDSNLNRLWAELDPKHRKKALKGALRRCANMVRKEAGKQAQAQFSKANKNLGKTVLAAVYRERAVGFKVYVSPKARKAMYTNRRGLEKPVLFWAATGTKQRKTRGRGWVLKSKGINRGVMKPYSFLKDADRIAGPRAINSLKTNIVESITKTAKKYGCKV